MASTSLLCHICNFCDLKFKNSDDLKLHNQLHTGSGKFSCPLCKETFQDLSQLQLHDLQHSLEEIKDERSSLPINITFIHPASSFACKMCNKVFLSDEELFDHIIAQHADPESFIYLSSSESNDQYETHGEPPITHTVSKRNNHKSDLEKTAKHLRSDVKDCYECITCKKLFNGPSSLDRHQRRFHLNKRKYMCTTCPKTYTNLYFLSEHSIQHYKTKRQDFECYICNKYFSLSRSLLEHILISHGGRKKHFCQACFKIFSSKDNLATHMEDHIAAYNCNKCKKWYQTKSKLSNHRCVLNRPRPYVCKICGKRFNRLYHLQRHCYLHDKEQGFTKVLGVDSEFFKKQNLVHNAKEVSINFKKKYECYMCTSRWYSLKNYKQHFLSEHKGLEFNACPTCLKKFDKTSRVKRHLVTHSKEKLFECNLCSKSFSVQSALNRHKKKHSGQELLSCYQCTNTFVNKSGFQKHILMHEQGREASFNCTLCDKNFSKEKLLNEHILAHHDFFKKYQYKL